MRFAPFAAAFIGLSALVLFNQKRESPPALKASDSPKGKLHAEGRFFVDEQGRAVILRGVNIAGNSKVPPFIAFQPADLDVLPSLGFNSIRLLFTWEAYEATEGSKNREYLDWLKAVAKHAGELGLYVVLDFHQDGFSRYSSRGCGSGFPRWAVTATPEVPDNGEACKSWGFKMSTDPGMHQSFGDFYANKQQIRAKYIKLWTEVATEFRAIDSVVGYDVMNEPWGSETKEIAPLYQDVGQAIRQVHPEAILFLEPHLSVGMADMLQFPGSDLIKYAVGLGSFDTNLPKPALANVAYAPHLYMMWAMLKNSYDGNDGPLKESVKQMAKLAGPEGWSAPVWVGEFGSPAAFSTDSPKLAFDLINSMYQTLDEQMMSGAQWVYTPGFDTTNLDGWNRENLSINDGRGGLRISQKKHPYPSKIAGTPLSFGEQIQGAMTSRLTVQWQNDPAKGATEIYAPKDAFVGRDVRIDTSGTDAECAYASDKAWLLTCKAATAGKKTVLVIGNG